MKEKRKAWYLRFECGDWITGTMAMSDRERGAYITMLSWSWGSGGIPDNDVLLPMIGMSDVDVVRRVLELKWTKGEDGRWRNARMEFERARAQSISNSAVGASHRRWEHSSHDQDASDTGCERISERICDRNTSQSQSQSQSQSSETEITQESLTPFVGTARRRASTTKKSPVASQIKWTADTGWAGIDDATRERWSTANPGIDVKFQLAQANLWLVGNPTRTKSNYFRFLTSWMLRAQERGGSVHAVSQFTRPTRSNF